MTEFMQITVGVVTLACVYALVAFGWNVVYSVTGILNLAQGEFFMLGGIIAATNMDRGLPVAVGLGIAGPTVVALLMETALLRPLAQKGRIFHQIVITLAVAIFLREATAWRVGPDPFFGPDLINGPPVELLGAYIPRQSLLVWGVTAALGILLWLLFSRTTFGAALRACAEAPEGAAVIGLQINRLRLAALGLAGLLGGLAGVLMSALTPVAFNSGTFVGLKGFIAAAIGGLGLLGGAIVGSIFVAALEGYFAAYVSDVYRDVLVFSSMIAVLLFRPAGLLRSRTGRRRQRPAKPPHPPSSPHDDVDAQSALGAGMGA